MKEFKLVTPSEDNDYSLFCTKFENDPTILFHGTSKENLVSILTNSFKSSFELGSGDLKSVSYGKKSSVCLTHLHKHFDRENVVFAVKFATLNQPGIMNNYCDIHVFNKIQPDIILGYCLIPKSFTYI